MRKTREIFRLKWCLDRSHREVARSLGVSVGLVGVTMKRAENARLDWATVQMLTDEELERRLYARRDDSTSAPDPRPGPDCAGIDVDLRKPGVTLALLHLEYLERYPNGYQYTQFCEHYRRWRKGQRLSMRQVYRAGEKLFVDYAGKKPHIVDPVTGECLEVEFFVAALGASNLVYAEATFTQRIADWIGSHVRMFGKLRGAPVMVVPDQLKSGVTGSCRYEPGLQRAYEEMACHYGTAIVPARPASPRDKAKVEGAVLIAERWILARLRNETFFSLEALNERIAELCEELNNRIMRRYGKSRRQLFDELDRPALRSLPAEPFVYGEWKLVKPGIDYHVEFDHHYYSVPFQLRPERLEVRASDQVIEIFHQSRRVASHVRSYLRGRHTTCPEHMPKSHREHAEWSPTRLIQWGGTIGPQAAALVEAILVDRPHPEQGYRSCLGLLRLSRRYGNDRLEAACKRAMSAGARSYRHVESILKHGLDRLEVNTPVLSPATPIFHENVRGSAYYLDLEPRRSVDAH
jgi:transposase